MHRNDQGGNLWLQQTECSQHIGDGQLRSTRDTWLQHEKAGERMGIYEGRGSRWMKQSRKFDRNRGPRDEKFGDGTMEVSHSAEVKA
jgi:hypothetical protein